MSVQVEFLENHVYCLLPSIGSNIGSVRIYSQMPDFIKELSFHLFLGKVNLNQDNCLKPLYNINRLELMVP